MHRMQLGRGVNLIAQTGAMGVRSLLLSVVTRWLESVVVVLMLWDK